MDKLLSVIVPVYNSQEYLSDCIESLIKSLTPEMEIILVDDGSVDQSNKICNYYSSENEQIKVISQKNCGVISARKTGIINASGEYITYVDSDDWVDADMYREMLEKIKKYNVDIVICDMVRETERGQSYLPNYVKEGLYDKKMLEKEFYPKMLFDFQVCNPAVSPSLCNKIIKRELIEKVIFEIDDSIVFGEDALCSYPVMTDAKSIYVMRKALYHYRHNFSSVTNTYDEKLMKKFLLLYSELKKQFEKRSFNEEEQLNGYVANHSILCVRKELLNKSLPIKERIKRVKNYIENEKIYNAIDSSTGKFTDAKKKTKLKYIYKKKLYRLFVLFLVKESFLEISRKRKKQ